MPIRQPLARRVCPYRVIAVIRGAEPVGLVVLLTVLALGTGPVTWVPALIAAFALPRSRPCGRGRRVEKGS